MAYLDDITQASYYNGSNYGNYQFVSLEDIINQFMVVYIGEDKIIPKAQRIDIAFHAQRALAELSFDTFKSIKAYQIDVPNSLTMILPHDYVNYTKLSWADTAGIKHPLYPTKHTSNPFQIRQHADGSYDFPENFELVANEDFSTDLTPSWTTSAFAGTYILVDSSNIGTVGGSIGSTVFFGSSSNIVNNELKFTHSSHPGFGVFAHGKSQAVWQEIDVSDIDYLDIKATATTVAATTQTWTPTQTGNNQATYTVGVDETGDIPETTVRFGLSTTPGDPATTDIAFPLHTNDTRQRSRNATPDIFNLSTLTGEDSYLEWTAGEAANEKELFNIDVSGVDVVYAIVTSIARFTDHAHGERLKTLSAENLVDNISVQNAAPVTKLQTSTGNSLESSTWKSYKSNNPTENTTNNYDYDDDRFDLNLGQRYGLNPEHAQVNGSFFIDDRLGKIHFSSNISGKTVILDYISDSLGTDAEMKVHKLAEDAMYKHILCGVMSARANVGRGQILQYKKDKFAATRQAKLRLSNIKLEELTQILRGKSKQIKH